MKALKDYKGVLFMYLIVTIVSSVWMVCYEKPDKAKQVNNDSKVEVVYNYVVDK